MRQAVLARALTAVAVCGLTSLASAQDGGAAPWRLEARALDATTMMQQSHGGSAPSNDIALSRLPVLVFVGAPGGGDATKYETESDLLGNFVVAGERPLPGAAVDFIVPHGVGGADHPGFVARTWVVDDGPAPTKVQFFEVAEDSEDIGLPQVVNVVTTVAKDDGSRVVQFRRTAMVVNRGAKARIGSPSDDGPVSFSAPLPAGFELRNVTVNSNDAPLITGSTGHSDGLSFIYREPIFPTGSQRPLIFQILAVGPYKDGDVIDASWHLEYPVGSYSLNIEEGLFGYLQPESSDEGVALADGGVLPPMGNTKIVTHSYTTSGLRPHATVAARISAGRLFPWRAVIWIAALILLVSGAALIGVAVSRRDAARAKLIESAQTRVKVPATEEGRAHELEMLDRRLKRGEITTVEHQVRRSAIEAALHAAPRVASAAPTRPRTKPSADLRARLDAIAARTGDASPEELRRDVQTLAVAVRELLGG